MDMKRPKKGSRAFWPRKRAKSQVADMFWPQKTDNRVLGFAGYKVGMVTIAYIDQSESPTKGQEIVGAATILETPPIYVYGIRTYKNQKIYSEQLASDEAKLKILGMKKIKKNELGEDEINDVRILVFTQPNKTLFGKKHPERFELGLGGKDIKEKLALAKSLLGKEIRAKDIFKPGEIVDIVAITKGKGWQGVAKRFGTSLHRPKSSQRRRHGGTLGQWHPAYVLYTVPQAGQMGYQKRTELNKTIMKISDNPDEINTSSGFPHYGFVKNDCILVKGSIPGPTKRLIKMRLAVRESVCKPTKLTYLGTKQ